MYDINAISLARLKVVEKRLRASTEPRTLDDAVSAIDAISKAAERVLSNKIGNPDVAQNYVIDICQTIESVTSLFLNQEGRPSVCPTNESINLVKRMISNSSFMITKMQDNVQEQLGYIADAIGNITARCVPWIVLQCGACIYDVFEVISMLNALFSIISKEIHKTAPISAAKGPVKIVFTGISGVTITLGEWDRSSPFMVCSDLPPLDNIRLTPRFSYFY
jgi:hypothetical protein